MRARIPRSRRDSRHMFVMDDQTAAPLTRGGVRNWLVGDFGCACDETTEAASEYCKQQGEKCGFWQRGREEEREERGREGEASE